MHKSLINCQHSAIFSSACRCRLIGSIAATVIAFTAINDNSNAGVITFGSGATSFQIEFVEIANPNNTSDTTGDPTPAGSIPYTYSIGKYEISENIISRYNSSNPIHAITKDARGPNKPATNVSWNEAARFVNWLNTSTGGWAAYKFTSSGTNDNISPWTTTDTADYDPSNPFRSKRAKYVLPSYNEWYKAAYYNPFSGTYFKFPTTSNTIPTPVPSGTAAGTVVMDQTYAQGPADVFLSGGLSPYGVMGLGGNVWEWEESTFDVTVGNYNQDVLFRGIRGGSWQSSPTVSSSSSRSISHAWYLDNADRVGFRVAAIYYSTTAVPEPSGCALFALLVVVCLSQITKSERHTDQSMPI